MKTTMKICSVIHGRHIHWKFNNNVGRQQVAVIIRQHDFRKRFHTAQFSTTLFSNRSMPGLDIKTMVIASRFEVANACSVPPVERTPQISGFDRIISTICEYVVVGMLNKMGKVTRRLQCEEMLLIMTWIMRHNVTIGKYLDELYCSIMSTN